MSPPLSLLIFASLYTSRAVDAIADAAGRLSQAANQYSSHQAFREKLNELLKAGGATATAVAKDRVLQVCAAMHRLSWVWRSIGSKYTRHSLATHHSTWQRGKHWLHKLRLTWMLSHRSNPPQPNTCAYTSTYHSMINWHASIAGSGIMPCSAARTCCEVYVLAGAPCSTGSFAEPGRTGESPRCVQGESAGDNCAAS